MPHDPFLALVERALADPAFLEHLQQSPEGALAAAGFCLSEEDATTVRELARRHVPDPAVLAQALVEVARRREN